MINLLSLFTVDLLNVNGVMIIQFLLKFLTIGTITGLSKIKFFITQHFSSVISI